MLLQANLTVKSRCFFIKITPDSYRRKSTSLGRWDEPCKFAVISLGFQYIFVS